MDNSHKKFTIITASILLHAFTLFVILVLYHQPSSDLFADFDPSKAIDITETIFSDPQSEQTSTSPQTQVPDDEGWGQFKPRASTLGASMEMPDGPIGVQMPGQVSDSNANTQDQVEDGDDSSNSEGNQNSLEFNPQISFENQESLVTSIGKETACFDKLSTNGVEESSNAKKKSTTIPFHPEEHASASRRKARKALAGITQGYLQQLQDEGENLIKTLGGDPNKKPTAEQLKYERYLAKIQWCLQNAHSINQEKCQLHESIDSAMKVYFVLNREGKMTGFKILQSSGKAYVDQYISSLFQFASSSFPPLPAYIKEDYFPLTYTVMVNWNSNSHMGFSRY